MQQIATGESQPKPQNEQPFFNIQPADPAVARAEQLLESAQAALDQARAELARTRAED